MGINLCAFSAAQKVCSKLENQAKCDSAVFVTNSMKIHFLHTFWLLEVAVIARTNYNCKIGHRAQPVYIILSRKQITKTLIRLHRCVGWSASLLFAYGINRFSHDVARLTLLLSLWTTYRLQRLCKIILPWSAMLETSNRFCCTSLIICLICLYLHLPLTFLRWTILDQLASNTDEGQLIMWRCRYATSDKKISWLVNGTFDWCQVMTTAVQHVMAEHVV